MALSDFDTPKLWRDDLDQRWPERLAMKDVIKRFLVEHCDNLLNPMVLELGIGDGELLTDLVERLPLVQLTAMDINQVLLDYCKASLSNGGVVHERATFIKQDLSQAWSKGHEGTFDTVYSFQSIHDFGGRDALISTYQNIAAVLKPGGVLVNADFVVPLPQDKQANPRRFPVEEHLQILNTCGFEKATVIHEAGLLGCVVATLPSSAA